MHACVLYVRVCMQCIAYQISNRFPLIERRILSTVDVVNCTALSFQFAPYQNMHCFGLLLMFCDFARSNISPCEATRLDKQTLNFTDI